jgi:hypothetical protein
VSAGRKAGEVGALRPEATRNEQVLNVKDEVQWNDLLRTLQTGRLRARLLDGSLLSMGSNSHLRVLQHDATSQQTELELSYGRLRSRVVKLTKPGAKYELKTPHAVIGVIGTDFYVNVDDLRTQVIVYSGRVLVKRVGQEDTQPGRELVAGQMLEIRGPGIPPSAPKPPGATPPEPTPGAPPPATPGAAPPAATPVPGTPPAPAAPGAVPGAAPALGSPGLPPLPVPQPTPPGVQEDSIEQTAVDEGGGRPPWNPTKKKILIIGGIIAAIIPVIIVLASDDPPVCVSCSSGP